MNEEIQEDPEARASLEAALAQQEPEKVKLTCPNCKATVNVGPADLKFDRKYGRSTVCPTCKKRFLVVRWVKRAT